MQTLCIFYLDKTDFDFVSAGPRIFSLLFSMIKPFLSEATVSKIGIFDSNEKSWQKAVRDAVDEDQLPPKYGGTKNDLTQFT
jgi:hypothetical protein